MGAGKASIGKPRKRTARRIIKWALPGITVLIILVFLLIPVFISSKSGGRMILARINGAITGRADFADLSMGWFKGIKVDELSFKNEAGGVSVEVERVSANPSYASILAGNVSLGRTVIDKPKVDIDLRGFRNEQSGKTGDKRADPRATAPPALPIKTIDLVLNDGSVKLTGTESGTVELSQINSKVNLQPPGERSDFDVKMVVAKNDKTAQIKASGNVKTKAGTGWSLEGTTGELTAEVNDLDLESLAPIFALTGVEIDAKGVVTGTTTSRVEDGRIDNLTANIRGKKLEITAAKLKGDRLHTSDLNIAAKLTRNQETISIDKLGIETDWASASATGTIPTSIESATDFLEADSKYKLKGDISCDLAVLASQMPRTLGLKKTARITSGTLIGNVETVTSQGRRQFRADASIADLEGTVDDKKAGLSESLSAEALISSEESGITFDKLDVTAPFAGVNCTGNLESLQYDADVNLEKLQSELGQFIDIVEYEIAGKFISNGRVSVKADTIAASGSSTVTDLKVTSPDGQSVSEPKTDIRFDLNIDRKEHFLAVNSAGADTTFGNMSISNGVLPLDEKSPKTLNATVSASRIDLQKLLPFGIMFASVPKEMQLSGIANSTLSVSAEDGLYKVVTDSTMIDDLKLVHPDAEKPFGPNDVTLALDAEIDPNKKTVNVKTFQLESPQIKIKKARLSKTTNGKTARVSGEVELDYEWSAVSTVAAPFLPEGLNLEGSRKDTIHFGTEYPADQSDLLLPNLNARGRLGFERADYKGLNFGSTDMEVRVESGVLKIAQFTAPVNEGQFSIGGQVDFNEKEPLFKIAEPMQIVKDIKINDEMTNELLKYVNPIFADAVNVSGFANFNCEQLAIPLKSEAKNDAVAIGTISMNRVRLQGSNLVGQILTTSGGEPRSTEMKIHPTKIALKDGFLRYDDMQVDVGDNPVNFKGAIGLDKSLDMTATLPYTTEGRTARVGEETEGERIELPIKGSVDAPELDLGKLLEDQLKGQLQEQLEKALEDLFK